MSNFDNVLGEIQMTSGKKALVKLDKVVAKQLRYQKKKLIRQEEKRKKELKTKKLT